MSSPDDQPQPREIGNQRRADDAHLADLTAPPSVEQARERHRYWHQRASQIPMHRRAERNEAQEEAARWKQRLEVAERERHGPGLLEQARKLFGSRWRPNARRFVVGLGALALVAVLLIVVIVAF